VRTTFAVLRLCWDEAYYLLVVDAANMLEMWCITRGCNENIWRIPARLWCLKCPICLRFANKMLRACLRVTKLDCRAFNRAPIVTSEY